MKSDGNKIDPTSNRAFLVFAVRHFAVMRRHFAIAKQAFCSMPSGNISESHSSFLIPHLDSHPPSSCNTPAFSPLRPRLAPLLLRPSSPASLGYAAFLFATSIDLFPLLVSCSWALTYGIVLQNLVDPFFFCICQRPMFDKPILQ